jgi:hypothetical protein
MVIKYKEVTKGRKMIYVLLVFAHVSIVGKGNSNSVTTQEFSSLENCLNASKEFKNMSDSTLTIKTKCVVK